MSEESPDRRSRSKLAPKIPDDEVSRPSGGLAQPLGHVDGVPRPAPAASSSSLASAERSNGHASGDRAERKSSPAITPLAGTSSILAAPMRAPHPSTPSLPLVDSQKRIPLPITRSTSTLPLALDPPPPIVTPVGGTSISLTPVTPFETRTAPASGAVPSAPVIAHAAPPAAVSGPALIGTSVAHSPVAPPTDPELGRDRDSAPPSSSDIPIETDLSPSESNEPAAPTTERNVTAIHGPSSLPSPQAQAALQPPLAFQSAAPSIAARQAEADVDVSVEVDIGGFAEAKVKLPPVPPPRASQPNIFDRARDGAPVLAPVSLIETPGPKKKGKPWWEELFNDDFLRTMEKLTDAQIATEATFIEESLSVAREAMVLDLACGSGRHAIELASRGYQVVGLDLSLSMLAKASEEALERDRSINFVHGDMRELTFEETFDGIYCWNTSFGFFDEDKNTQVIQRVHRALKKGGQFLLDVVNRDYLLPRSPSLVWFEGEGCICMDEMHIDAITSRMKIKRTMMIEDGRTREIEYSVRLYTLHELGRILHEQGFRVAEVSGQCATPGVFFGSDSPRTIILAEKR